MEGLVAYFFIGFLGAGFAFMEGGSFVGGSGGTGGGGGGSIASVSR